MDRACETLPFPHHSADWLARSCARPSWQPQLLWAHEYNDFVMPVRSLAAGSPNLWSSLWLFFCDVLWALVGRGCGLVLNTPQLLIPQTVESLSNCYLLYKEAFWQGSGFAAKATMQEVFTNKRWDWWLFSLSFNLSLFVIFALNSKYIKQMASGCSIVCL